MAKLDSLKAEYDIGKDNLTGHIDFSLSKSVKASEMVGNALANGLSVAEGELRRVDEGREASAGS